MIDISQARCVFLPDSLFKRRWNLYIAVLLIYTGIFVPLRIAFYDKVDLWVIIVECFVDLSFLIDIVFSFTSAFDRRDGQVETRHRKIANRYFKGWFFIDLISTLPTQLLEVEWGSDVDFEDATNVKLMRLARIPRIYKILRLLRLLKMLRFLSQNKQISKFTELFQLQGGSQQLVIVATGVLFLTHTTACLWFMQSKLNDFPCDSWVTLEGIVESPVSMQYTQAAYWALQTITTVGFGDISPKNPSERIFAIIWMIIGVAFYSYAIGNMTNLIATMDASNEELQAKLSILKEFK